MPLLYQPGDRWVYSVAHDVQAALVEKLSGQKFDEFVRQRIFRPLEMNDSMFKVPADKKSRVPALYSMGRDGKLAVDSSPLGTGYGDQVFGGYSISTTIGDYALFAQMLLNKGQLNGVRLLSPKTVELMAMNHLSATALANGGVGPGTGYGLGVSVLMNPAERGNIGSVGEFGWSGAASTHVLIDPKEDMVAVYCTQLMGGRLRDPSELRHDALPVDRRQLMAQDAIGPGILAIERPHRHLLWLYVIRAVLTGPGFIVVMPLLFFRYETMRFRFDAEGVHMRWGILFRRQINLTYARIQDIHLTSGFIQRWLGLADIKIQTASGSSGAEMTLEGLIEFEAVRDFLYTRMRGYRDRTAHEEPARGVGADGGQAVALLRDAIDELRATRIALERQAGRGGRRAARCMSS
jgi:membrane protein YdbS with pleckstrin-like domain